MSETVQGVDVAYQRPASAMVIGAGMVGLSTAWFLQREGVAVTVLDRSGVAAGASWGNAGWLSPALACPLAEPALLRYAPRALLDPAAALHIPARPDPAVLGFLARFALHCTHRAWRRSMAALAEVTVPALAAFDELTGGGVAAGTHRGPVRIGFERAADSVALRRELRSIALAGVPVSATRMASPHGVAQLSDRVTTLIELHGQRYIEPGPFVAALADAVRDRGGRIIAGAHVRALRPGRGGITAHTSGPAGPAEPARADAVVLATGAWLPELARPLGVRARVQAGRGYSFSVATKEPVEAPIYLPAARVACTPYQERLRIAGTMEFRGPDEAPRPERIDAIVASVRPLLRGVDWSEPADIWVGPRPMTPDGLPLVGATRAPGVYVAGGHGMWGITLGPITGRLLARQISTGRTPAELRPFDPLRRDWNSLLH